MAFLLFSPAFVCSFRNVRWLILLWLWLQCGLDLRFPTVYMHALALSLQASLSPLFILLRP